MACPFAGLAFSREDGIVVNCDLCGGEPECVAVCPAGALELAEVDSADKTKLLERVIAINERAPLNVAELLLSVNNWKFLTSRRG